MASTGPIDNIEREQWNIGAKSLTNHWMVSTLVILTIAYFLPLRWAVLFAIFLALLALLCPKLEDLDFAFPLPLQILFGHPQRRTVFATSVVLKDKSSGDTRARLHILNGEPALSFYGESGEETIAFTASSEARNKAETVGPLEGELKEINETLRELESRMAQFADAHERESDERNEKISSHSFELLDKEGKTRARLQTSKEGQPSLTFYDETGGTRACFYLNENNYAALCLQNFPKEVDYRNSSGIFLGFADKGRCPQLEMYDSYAFNGAPAVRLDVHKTGTGTQAGLWVEVWDNDANPRSGWFGAGGVRGPSPTPPLGIFP